MLIINNEYNVKVVVANNGGDNVVTDDNIMNK